MDGTFEWEDELPEFMASYEANVQSLESQIRADRDEDQKTQARDGINLTPIFAQIESFMYRIAKLERQNLEFETRIAQLEADRHAPSSSGSQ